MTMFSMAGTTPDRTLSVIYANGDTATIPETHDRFDELVSLLLSGAEDSEVSDLVDVMLAVTKRLSQLSERVSISGRHIYFDGDRLRGELADVLVELFEADNPESLRPVVNFLEKASTNPSRQSVDDLYRWITKGDLIIHEDGDFLAYKGTRHDSDGQRVSINSGTAFVDGVEVTGYIPNPDGAVITMPRSSVDDNSLEGCSTGLHAGTASYAFSFATTDTVLVKINPRDVVSVPEDSSSQKLRVCRYVVQGKVEGRRESRVFFEPVAEPDNEGPFLFLLGGDPWGVKNVEDIQPEGEEPEYEDVDDDEDEEADPDFPSEDHLSSSDALEVLRQKLTALESDYSSSPSEAQIEQAIAQAEAEANGDVIRDSKGRFTKESAVKAVRNAKGQFTRGS